MEQNPQNYNVLEDIKSDKLGALWVGLSRTPMVQELMRKTADFVAKGFIEKYSSEPIYDYKTPEISIEQISKGMRGTYNNGTIYINQTETAPYRDNSFFTIAHESTHYGQHYLIEKTPVGQDEKIDLMRHIMLGHNPTSTFGIETSGLLYVHAPKNDLVNFGNPELRDAFYRLCIVERMATREEMKMMSFFNADMKAINNRINRAFDTIRSHYNIPKTTDKGVCQLVDDAFLNIAQNRTPRTALEASITYDIAAMLHVQSNKVRAQNLMHGINHKDICEEIFDPIHKAEILESHGFEYSMTIPLEDIADYFIEDIQEMSQEARNQNPHLMLVSIVDFGDPAKELLDKEPFDRWYFSKQNMFGDKFLDKFAKQMGEEYEPSRKAAMIENEKEHDVARDINV